MAEYSYPGVYVTEVTLSAQPIEGVSTSTAPATVQVGHETAEPAAPSWSQHNQGDPGFTWVQLLAWLGDMTLFRAQPPAGHHVAHPFALWGVSQGLVVEADDDGANTVHVTPGSASGTDGQPVSADSKTAAHRIHRP